MKPSLAPEQLRAVQNIITTASQVSATINMPLKDVEGFITRVSQFVKSNHRYLDGKPLLLLLSKSRIKKPLLTETAVKSSIMMGKEIFYVDNKLHLVSVADGECSFLKCTNITEKEKTFGVRIADTHLLQFLNGKIIGDIDILQAKTVSQLAPVYFHSMADFVLLLDDHMESRINNQKGFKYWQDPEKRILRAKPGGTEAIFHHDLFWWLSSFVSDRIKVFGETRGLGQIKTDITVVARSGVYVVEVKWLGKNENKDEYGAERINEGLAQVKIYLEKDSDLTCGYLVAYDGRSLDDHKRKSDYKKSLKHKYCEPPKILFLPSENPSKAAVQMAKRRSK